MRLQFTGNSNYRIGSRVAITGIATTISLIVIMASLSFSPLLISSYAQSILDGMTPQERHEELKRLHQLQQQRLQQQPPTSPLSQPQQPTQTAPPVTASPPTTPSTTTTQTQDPDFTQFIEIAGQCANSATFGSSGATMTQEQCTQFLEQGQEKWCGLAAYDAQKCDQATRLTAAWNNMVNLSERYGLSDIPSLGELGIDPRTIVP